MRILGWDSETTNGYVKLLANSDGHIVETRDTVSLLDFLFAEGMRADYNVFWNVRFDFGCIVKPWVVENGERLKANHLRAIRNRKEIALLDGKLTLDGSLPPDDMIRRAALQGETDDLESVEHFDVGPYHVFYIPKKGFRISRRERKRGRNSVTFFDAMPWYSTGISESIALDAAARRYLGGEHKTADEEGVDTATLGATEGYYEDHRDAIVRYCIRDCELTAALFARTVAGFDAIGIPFPKQPWSRASVGREVLRVLGVLETTREAYGKLDESGHARLWRDAFAGACILTRGIGTWVDVSKWDINSAYPRAMVEFPSLEGAYIVGPESPEFEGCFFKFYDVELTPTPRRALTASGRKGDHLLYVEGGAPRRVCVTALDLDIFDLWGDRYRVMDAVGIVTPSPKRPLAFLGAMYAAKTRIKEEFGEDSVEYLNAKIPMNGIYGIVAQSKPRAGRYTNFIYAAYVTAWCRRELWTKAKEIQDRGGTILAQMTDGLLVDGLSSLPAPSKELGAWDVEDVGTATLFANGIYVVKGKLKKRGAPDLTLKLLMSCRRPWVHVERSGPLGLKQAIIQGRPEEIGVWSTEEKDLVPWRMSEESGLRIPDGLRSAPLKEYFTTSWYLDHREPTEAKTAPRLLEVAP